MTKTTHILTGIIQTLLITSSFTYAASTIAPMISPPQQHLPQPQITLQQKNTTQASANNTAASTILQNLPCPKNISQNMSERFDINNRIQTSH